MKLYRYPNQSVAKYVKRYPGLTVLQEQPQAYWINDWTLSTRETVIEILKESHDLTEIPVFVWYMIPDRDHGSYSSGGTKDFETYYRQVRDFFQLEHSSSLVIFEPDALALDFSPRRTEVFNRIFAIIPKEKIKVFLDVGHPHWHPQEVIEDHLNSIAIDNLSGISINVSNFVDSAECEEYGLNICKKLGNEKFFVVDTSRNGNGSAPKDEWCNPTGRSLGEKPVIIEDESLHYANLWIKIPGESDGQCNGGPHAGVFSPDLALRLIRNEK